MYNLTVANEHSYYVGIGGVLGHNAGCTYFKLNPHKIRFTQDSIKAEFKNGKGSLQSTIQGLRNGTIYPDAFPPIRIVSYKGQLWTLDNRRLYVFQQAGLKIKTKIVFMKDVEEEFKKKFTTTNGGYIIRVRGER